METRRSGTGGGGGEGWYRGGDMYMHMYVYAKKSGPFPRSSNRVLTHLYRACINFNRLPIFSNLSPAAIRGKGHRSLAYLLLPNLIIHLARAFACYQQEISVQAHRIVLSPRINDLVDRSI